MRAKRSWACVVCIALLLSSCGTGGNPAPGGATSTAPSSASFGDSLPIATDALSVYLGDPFTGNDYIDQAMRMFQAACPDVNVQLTAITLDDLSATEKLPTELAAGRGPDLYVGGYYEFRDLYKTLNTGVFCDLNPFLQNDPGFQREDYVEGVLNAGLYQGKQLFIPLTYTAPILLTTEEALSAAGISKSDLSTFQGVMEAAGRYGDQNLESRAFLELRSMETFLWYPYAGVRYLDYENNAVQVDTPEFQMAMETHKKLCQQQLEVRSEDGISYSYTGDEVVQLEANKYLFEGPNLSPKDLEDYQMLLTRNTPVLLPLLTQEGKMCASVGFYTAISSASNNKANAYAFLKVLLSQKVQSQISFECSVNRAATRDKIVKATSSTGPVRGTDLIRQALNEEQIDAIWKIMTNVDEAIFSSGDPLNIVFNDMEPYFKGEAEYAQCLRSLKNDLTIYISE